MAVNSSQGKNILCFNIDREPAYHHPATNHRVPKKIQHPNTSRFASKNAKTETTITPQRIELQRPTTSQTDSLIEVYLPAKRQRAVPHQSARRRHPSRTASLHNSGTVRRSNLRFSANQTSSATEYVEGQPKALTPLHPIDQGVTNSPVLNSTQSPVQRLSKAHSGSRPPRRPSGGSQAPAAWSSGDGERPRTRTTHRQTHSK